MTMVVTSSCWRRTWLAWGLLQACVLTGTAQVADPGAAVPAPAPVAAAPARPKNIGVKVLFVQVGEKTAAAWGLDGGPAPDPAATPLKKDVPPILTAAEWRTLMTALREQKDTTLLTTVALATLSAQTASTQYLVRLNPARADSYDCGASLTVTPTLGDDQHTIDIEITATVTKIVAWVGATPDLSRIATAVAQTTHVVLPAGHTMLLGPLLYGPATPLPDAAAPALHDPRPVLMFLSVDLE